MLVVKLDKNASAPVSKAPPAEIVISGDGSSTLWNAVDVGGGEMLCGTWTGQPGELTVRPRAHHEVFVVATGLIELQDGDGAVVRFGPGESGYVPKGWTGVWRNIEETQKTYVLIKSVNNESAD